MSNDDTERESNTAQLDAQLEGWARLGKLIEHRHYTNYANALDRRIEEREEIEREGLLSAETERVIRLVLCTGGPHCEVRWEDGQNPVAICFGWWGAGRVERQLTDAEEKGFDRLFPDFDELWAMIGGDTR